MQAKMTGKWLLLPLALLLLAGVQGAIYRACGYLPALPMLMSPTADVAFILFALAFSSSSLLRLMPNAGTRYLVRNRRYIGLGFAMVHFTHLVLVLSNITLVAGEARPIGTLLPGVVAYVFIALMALTSNDISVQKLGARRWQLLHKIGGYYIWLIFLATTLPPGGENLWMLLVAIAVLVLRIYCFLPQAPAAKVSRHRWPVSLRRVDS